MSRAKELVTKATAGMASSRFAECGDDASCTCACGTTPPASHIPTSLDASNAVLASIESRYEFEGIEGLFGAIGRDAAEDAGTRLGHRHTADEAAPTITDAELLALADLSADELAALAELEAE